MARVEQTNLQFKVAINGEQKILPLMRDVKKERATILRQLDLLNKGSDEYNQKLERLRKLNSIVADHRKEVRGTQESFKAAGKGATGFRGIIRGLGTTLKAALGTIGLLAQAVTIFIGMTKDAFDASEEIGGVKERINQLNGAVGDDLNESAAKVVALSRTFETDMTKGIDAANAAANSYQMQGEELGETFNRSLDGIGERLLGLGDKGDEFLDQVIEYSSVAEEAGLSMDRFFNVVTTGINRGVPTDKLIDSIKEFDNRIKDISAGQRDALEGVLGKNFVDTLLDGINDGSIESIDALDEISQEITNLGVGSAQAKQIIANIFGGPGEDATSRYIALLDGVGEGLENVVDKSNIYVQRKEELNRLEEEAALAAAELNFLTDGTGDTFKKVGLQIKTFFINQLSSIIEFVQYFPEYFGAATSSGKAFANTLIAGFEKILRVGLFPFVSVIEKITGTTLKLPRFEIEDDPFAAVEDKIAADRKAYEERQRQELLKERNKTDQAERLQALQAERKRNDELAKERRKLLEARLKEEADAQKAIEDLKVAIIQNSTTRQIEALKLAAERQIESVKGSEEQKAEQTRLIREKLAQDILKVEMAAEEAAQKARKKRAEDRLKAEKDRLANDLKALESDLERKTLEITQGVVDAVEDGALTQIEAERSLQEQLKEEYIQFLEDKRILLESAGQDTTETELEIERAKLAKLAEIQEEEKARRGGLDKEGLENLATEKAFEFAEGLAQKALLNDLDRIDKRREALEKAEEAELLRAGNNEKAKLSIQKKFAKQKEELDKDAARAEKRIAIKKSLIDFALAMFKAIASAPPPINLGAIALQSALLTIPQGILSAITFDKGGNLPEAGKGGMTKGPSHSEGHILLVNGRTGEVVGAAEGGEPILSKATYRNNKPLVDMLLHSSMNKGGKSVFDLGHGEIGFFGSDRSLFNTGGFLPITNTTPGNDVSDTAQANPEIGLISSQIGDLAGAYREGKTIIVDERTADIIDEAIKARAADKLRRT